MGFAVDAKGGAGGVDPFTHMVASLPSVPASVNEFTAGFGSSNSYGLTDLQNATAQNTWGYYAGAVIGAIPGLFTGSDEANGARWLWKLDPCKCFVAGTIVQTKDGPVAIEKLKVGDLVVARDETTGQTAFKPVLRLVRNGEKKVVRLTLVNAAGKAESLGVTPEHPFMADGKHWIAAGRLKPGDKLMTLDGGLLTVKSVVKYGVRHHTYNFEVADFHTYFVGSEGAWVHNAGLCDLGALAKSGETAATALGRRAHKAYENTLGGLGYAFDRALPSGKRPDAVNRALNIVRELKPDSARAMRNGLKQLQGYKEELEKMTGETWTAILDTYKR